MLGRHPREKQSFGAQVQILHYLSVLYLKQANSKQYNTSFNDFKSFRNVQLKGSKIKCVQNCGVYTHIKGVLVDTNQNNAFQFGHVTNYNCVPSTVNHHQNPKSTTVHTKIHEHAHNYVPYTLWHNPYILKRQNEHSIVLFTIFSSEIQLTYTHI